MMFPWKRKNQRSALKKSENMLAINNVKLKELIMDIKTAEDSKQTRRESKPQKMGVRQQNGSYIEVVHKAFQPILYTALCFGIMPLYGISGNDSSKLQFKWKSGRLAMSLVPIVCMFALFTQTLYCYGITSRTTGALVFYSVSPLTMILFIRLARNWKSIVICWSDVISVMGIRGDEIITKLRFITYGLVFLSIFEHGLANANVFFRLALTEENKIEAFFKKRYSFVFTKFEYSPWRGCALLLIHLQATLAWNFTDIFIINVATVLAYIFQIYEKGIIPLPELKTYTQAVIAEKSLFYWKRKREVYCKLAALVKFIDRNISNLVLLSFGSNLFFICLQLYYTLTSGSGRPLIRNIYFCLSFGFLILRTVSVCLSAAKMYENSKKPLSGLFTIPSEQYNIEVQRLIDTINEETLALSGYNFFILNRQLIVAVTSTIATYELVLVQFHSFKE